MLLHVIVFIIFLVYVFMGTAKALVELMDAMETAKLFEKGEYFLIYVESNTYSDEYAYQYLWSK